MQKIEEELSDLQVQIVGISPDAPEKIQALLQEQEISYRLFSDSSFEAAKKFGVAYRVDDESFEALKSHGIDIHEASGTSKRLLPVPSVFLVDANGVVQYQYASADYKIRAEPEDIVAAARKLKNSNDEEQ